MTTHYILRCNSKETNRRPRPSVHPSFTPISEPFVERLRETKYIHFVQYFERVRLEYHPDSRDPLWGRIFIGRLGSAVLTQDANSAHAP